jgi:hypothetical protein
MLTVIVAWTAGTTTPCQADIPLNTPTGLTAGDTFRFVFVTDGTTKATSSDISTYDSFVTAQAEGATYNGVTVTWQAIGSTDTVNAIDHLGINPTLSGVYLSNGTEVAAGDGTSSGGIWHGTLLNPIDTDIAGVTQIAEVWTGTLPAGDGSSGNQLGNSDTVLGASDMTSAPWVDNGNGVSASLNGTLYGMSEVLTVPQTLSVPEPSSLIVAAFTSTVGIVLAGQRKRKERRRQRPTGQPGVSQNLPDA